MIYLDNASTTRINDEVLDVFSKLAKELLGNPSSNHKLGFIANEYDLKAKRQILKYLNLDDKYEIVFTSGCSESNNFLIRGIALRNKSFGTHLITSKVEHASVLEVFKDLEKEGFKVSYIDVDRKGNLNYEQLINFLDDKTTLVCIMGVNNEIGNIFDLEKISKIVKSKSKAYFISDVSQLIGKNKLDYRLLDGFSMSSHKIGGLKSSGFACFKKNVKISSLILGGHQQDNYRSGTIDPYLDCSLATAIRISFSTLEKRYENVKKLYMYLYEELSKMEDEISINSCLENTSYYILNFSLKRKKASILVEALSNKEVYVSTQSACSSKKEPSSYVLENMSFPLEDAKNAIRVSFSGYEDEKTVKDFIEILNKTLSEIKKR